MLIFALRLSEIVMHDYLLVDDRFFHHWRSSIFTFCNLERCIAWSTMTGKLSDFTSPNYATPSFVLFFSPTIADSFLYLDCKCSLMNKCIYSYIFVRKFIKLYVLVLWISIGLSLNVVLSDWMITILLLVNNAGRPN